MAKKRYPIVEVEWEDSAGYGRWDSIEAHLKVSTSNCRTAGYLIVKNRQHIVIAGSVDDSNGNLTDSMAIPRSAVRSFRKVGGV